jgi:hypothetical protein
MKFKSPIPGKPIFHFLSFVYSQIVHNYMNHFVFRAISVQLLKEIEEFYAGMALLHLTYRYAAVDYKGSEKTDGSVALVFKVSLSAAARPFWFVGVLAAEAMSAGLLIDSYNQSIFWWRDKVRKSPQLWVPDLDLCCSAKTPLYEV